MEWASYTRLFIKPLRVNAEREFKLRMRNVWADMHHCVLLEEMVWLIAAPHTGA